MRIGNSKRTSASAGLWLATLAILGVVLVAACANRRSGEPNPTGQADGSPGQHGPAPEDATPSHGPCNGATPVDETGFIKCDDGRVHRPEVVQCPSTIQDDSATQVDAGAMNPDDRCNRNADCTEKAYGWCAATGQLPIKTCHYGCTADSDCGEKALCMCAGPVGICLEATCRSDSECGEGALCSRYFALDNMEWGAFACDSPEDQCNTDQDCWGEGVQPRSCDYIDGARRCVPGSRPVY